MGTRKTWYKIHDLVESEYSNQMLLKSVWENAHIQNLFVDRVRKGYLILPITEEEIEEFKHRERQEQLKNQAALMREAKAKKRAERLAKENKEIATQKPVEKKESWCTKSSIK